jgi:GTP cyclohydrolase I
MEDVQSRRDERRVPIDQVGVTDLCYPIVVLDRERQTQQTVARVTMSVNLPHQFKGTHMSRFLEVLNRHRGEVTVRTLPEMLRELKKRLHAETAQVDVEFPYFLERSAPVSGARSLMEYECSFWAEVNGDEEDFVLSARGPGVDPRQRVCCGV